MSLFDSASLVITPNGVKEDKLYAIKPTDGSGDLVVTRATTATRVNSDGLIEPVAYNLLRYSQEFDNAAWTKAATSGGTISVTANYSTAPNGTLTADRLLVTNVVSVSVTQSIVSTSGIAYTSSIYLKSNTSSSYTYQLRDGYSGTLKTITVTPQWQRFDLNFSSSGTTLELQLRTLVAGASDISIWGAQLVTGTSAKEYFPTTDRLDVPRLDYTNSSCPSILVEPQRTNLALRSQEFDNASWTKVGATISANTTTSPSGIVDADKMIENVGSSSKYLSHASFSANTYTASVYVKPSNKTFFWMSLDSSVTAVFFNLTTGTIAATGSGNTGTIASVGNGWFRCTITRTNVSTQNLLFGTSDSSANYISNGNGVDGVFLWGAQTEAGSNATSYIPTIASSVTRNADVISKTGISSLIGQTEGTLFFESKGFSDGNPTFQFITLNDGTTNNQIGFSYTTSGVIQGYFRVNSVTNQISSTVSKTLNSKIILKYSSNNYKLFINGVLIGSGTSASGFSSPLTTFKASQGNDGSNYNGNLKIIGIWKTALTDAECITLTTI